MSDKRSLIGKVLWGGITALATLFGLVTFLTGRQSLNDFLPTPTAPQVIERVITATPAAFTGASFAAQPTNIPRTTAAPLSTSARTTAQQCGALTPRLQEGGYGRVFSSPNDNNRVRSEPGLAGTQVGIIPAGERFYVVEGPRCVDDILWWFVQYNSVEGWTAEGLGDRYYVEPS